MWNTMCSRPRVYLMSLLLWLKSWSFSSILFFSFWDKTSRLGASFSSILSISPSFCWCLDSLIDHQQEDGEMDKIDEKDASKQKVLSQDEKDKIDEKLQDLSDTNNDIKYTLGLLHMVIYITYFSSSVQYLF